MRRAIALSALGIASTSPNPPVGCVILDSLGEIVGDGYHERKGEAHAEARALEAAGTQAAGGTAVVTLEPCNHSGRTPPCHQGLIDAGIARIVVAVLDPTSRGDGGVALLREAGMDVEVGLLKNEALLVLGPWLAALEAMRPVVTWSYAVGADGVKAVPEDLALSVYTAIDTVVDDSGRIWEGRPGSHGAGVYSIPALSPDAGPKDYLAALYAEGTRSLLLNAGLPVAQPFLQTGLVDEIRAYLRGSSILRTAALLPAQFGIRRIHRTHDGVVIDAVRLR